MSHPNPQRALYLGMREGDLANKPYARFWNPQLAPLSAHARQALLHGPVAAPLLPPLFAAPRLLADGPAALEDGYAVLPDGSLHVAIRTPMPDVSPAMIDWWFDWHNDEPQRYKLWHPLAHVHAQWGGPAAASPGPRRYVGRVSYVDEYLGSNLTQVAIGFLPPAELGFDERALADAEKATVVCARVGFVDQPLQLGYLLHHVRRLPGGGAEMRSRFFIGGPYAQVKLGPVLGPAATRLARLVRRPTEENARDLLVHCAHEMAHLASFLPALYRELGAAP